MLHVRLELIIQSTVELELSIELLIDIELLILIIHLADGCY